MGKKMLGREAVADHLADFGKREWCEEIADKIIDTYLAHMATLGWKMMSMTMDEEQLAGVVHGFPQFQGHEDRLQDLHRTAYDHAPEPTEGE